MFTLFSLLTLLLLYETLLQSTYHDASPLLTVEPLPGGAPYPQSNRAVVPKEIARTRAGFCEPHCRNGRLPHPMPQARCLRDAASLPTKTCCRITCKYSTHAYCRQNTIRQRHLAAAPSPNDHKQQRQRKFADP